MALPTVGVFAAFGDDPFAAAPSYTDLSSRFRKASISIGRQHQLGQFQAGSCSVEMENGDRLLDPLYTSGTYGTTVQPGKKTQIRLSYGGTTKNLYTGYIDRVLPTWPEPKEALVTFELLDAFDLFARRRLIRGIWPEWIPKWNPRAWYRMNDDAGATVMKDYAPTPHDGAYTAAKVSVAGPITTDPTSTALDCGPLTDAAVGDVLAGLDGASFQGGVGIWVQFFTLPPGGTSYTLFDQIIDGAGGHLALRITDAGNFRVNEMANTWTTGPTVAADGEWHYLVFLRRGGTAELWIDGVRETPIVVGAINYAQDAPHFGELTDGTKAMDGRIAEAVLWYNSIPTPENIVEQWRDVSAGDWSGQRTDQRIETLLDSMGFPLGDYTVANNGLYTIQPIVGPLRTNYLEHMQKVIETEMGLLFMNGDGEVYFDKERPATAPAPTVTFGEGVGEVHFHESPPVEYSKEGIINDVELRADGMPDAFASDQASIDARGWSSHSQSGLLFTVAADLVARAARLISQYKDPKVRPMSVKISSNTDPATTVPIIRDTALGDTVTAKPPHAGVGSPAAILCEVEGINYELGPEGVEATYALNRW